MGEKLQFTELDQYLFGQGTHYDIYRKLGPIRRYRGEKKVYILLCGHRMHRSVSVIGEFNDWNTDRQTQ